MRLEKKKRNSFALKSANKKVSFICACNEFDFMGKVENFMFWEKEHKLFKILRLQLIKRNLMFDSVIKIRGREEERRNFFNK